MEKILSAMTKVESSTVDEVGFQNDKLYVKFKNGNTYVYLNVGEDVYESLIKSESKGKFLNESIKTRFTCQKL